MSVSFGKFQNAVVWGVKGKILCPAGCQNPIFRITKAKENLKSPRSAGSWRPFKCIFGERKKAAHSGLKTPPRSLYVRKTRTGAVCGSLRASFYHGAKIRNSAVLPLEGNLLGSAFPKPCYGGLHRKNISVRQAAFLREPPRKYLTDQPIFCDK